MSQIVIVFAFDKTIIDLKSDHWVLENFNMNQVFDDLFSSQPWYERMDMKMNELHANGKTIEDLKDVLKRVPIHPQIISAIKSAHALGCDLRIVSNANIFFIETILEHHGIRTCFSEINSNPSFVDEDGKLRISPYHDCHLPNHGCEILPRVSPYIRRKGPYLWPIKTSNNQGPSSAYLQWQECPPNLCKGVVLERIQASVANEKKRFIYIGHGGADFCPTLKLKQGDFVMPRKNYKVSSKRARMICKRMGMDINKIYPIWNLINRNRELIKADVHEWSNGGELEDVLHQLINKVLIEEDNNLNASSSNGGT